MARHAKNSNTVVTSFNSEERRIILLALDNFNVINNIRRKLGQ